jgi:hypothetical protein
MAVVNLFLVLLSLILLMYSEARSIIRSSAASKQSKYLHQLNQNASRVLYDHNLPEPVMVHQLRHHRRLDAQSAELTPLYPGYGTHYAFLYVGTPPQRQSVIIDTGSHYTAFPCVGCQQCGQHTDPYYDSKNSSTSKVLDCGKGEKCVVSQSYSEGSSWRAYRVEDQVYVGGLTDVLTPGASKYAVSFTFGCQTYETGTVARSISLDRSPSTNVCV